MTGKEKRDDDTQAAEKQEKPAKKPPTVKKEAGAEENHAAEQEKRTTSNKKSVSAADKPADFELMFKEEELLAAQEKLRTMNAKDALEVIKQSDLMAAAAQKMLQNSNFTAAMEELKQKIIEPATKAAQIAQQIFQSDEYQTQYKYDNVVIPKNAAAKKKAAESGEEVQLQPDSAFIGLVLAEYQEKGELQEVTVADIIKESYTEAAERTDSKAYTKLLKRAAALYAEYDKDPAAFESWYEAELEKKATIQRVTPKRVTKQDFPIDNVNKTVWKNLNKDDEGQISFYFKTLPNKKEDTVYYSLNFEKLKESGELKITKKLTPYDRRVYNAIAALYNGGNDIISLTQIYPLMGYSGRPGKYDLTKINDSIIKMSCGRLQVDNTPEHTATKGKYTKFTYRGSLLPIEIITADIDGQVTEGAIHIFREPPLISFAKERKQITTIKSVLLQTGLSNTEGNILITDYLIEYIGALKRPKSQLSDKLTLETIYKNCGITTKIQKARAPEKIKTILTGFKDKAFIKNFTLTKEAVTFKV